MRFILKTIFVNFTIALILDLTCASFVALDKTSNNNDNIKRQKSDTNDSEVVTEGKSTTSERKNGLSWKEIRKQIQASLNQVTRCSRRFYPGVCSEPVSSVWTYSIKYQNCTERFGCHYSSQSNRFANYYTCLHNCKPLIDITTYILGYQESITSDEYGDSDEDSSDYYESGEEEDNAVWKKVKNARRNAAKTLQNVISSVKEDYGYSDEPSLGFPDSHDVEIPEDLQRSLPVDLDQEDHETMNVNYDFNSGQARLRNGRGFY